MYHPLFQQDPEKFQPKPDPGTFHTVTTPLTSTTLPCSLPALSFQSHTPTNITSPDAGSDTVDRWGVRPDDEWYERNGMQVRLWEWEWECFSTVLHSYTAAFSKLQLPTLHRNFRATLAH